MRSRQPLRPSPWCLVAGLTSITEVAGDQPALVVVPWAETARLPVHSPSVGCDVVFPGRVGDVFLHTLGKSSQEPYTTLPERNWRQVWFWCMILLPLNWQAHSKGFKVDKASGRVQSGACCRCLQR